MTKQVKFLISSIAIVTITIGGGWFRLKTTTLKPAKSTTVSILSDNFVASEKWDESTVNALAEAYFKLLKETESHQSKLLIWPESAVPWTYSPQDAFIDSALQFSKKNNQAQIIGINTDAQNNKVYNSAYYFAGDSLISYYNKQYLLKLVEQPLFNYNLPFIQTDGFYALSGTKNTNFTYENIEYGVLICNESNVSKAAIDKVEDGAEVLLLISNDSWFHKSKLLTKLHFLNAKMRAVETGRSMVINSNLGICGYINPLGQELVRIQNNLPYTKPININTSLINTSYTIYHNYIKIVLILSLILIVCIVYFKN